MAVARNPELIRQTKILQTELSPSELVLLQHDEVRLRCNTGMQSHPYSFFVGIPFELHLQLCSCLGRSSGQIAVPQSSKEQWPPDHTGNTHTHISTI